MKLYKVKKSKHFTGEAVYFNLSNKSNQGKYLFLQDIKFNATHTSGWVEAAYYCRNRRKWRPETLKMDVRIIRWLLAYKADNLSTAATMAHLKTTLKLIDIDEESKQ